MLYCNYCNQLTVGKFSAEDIASLVYLWNPFTIATCVGSSTSPLENMMIVLSLYGACSRKNLSYSRNPMDK